MLQPIPFSESRERRTVTPLPSYRYVPGLLPHPIRHPDGHMATQKNINCNVRSERCRLWGYGLDLFEHRYMWEAHESWEQLWHHHRSDQYLSSLVQGMILGAASCLKKHMQAQQQADRLFRRSCSYLVQHTGGGLGVNIKCFQDGIADFLAGGDWPSQVGGVFIEWQDWP